MWLSLNPCDHTRTVGAHPYVHCCQKCKHRKTEGSLQLQCLAGVQYWSSPSLESNTLLHSPSIKPSSLFPLPSTISLPLRNVCLFLCWFPSSPRWFRRCIPICHAQPHLCYSHHFLLGFLPAYLKLFCSLSYFFSFFFQLISSPKFAVSVLKPKPTGLHILPGISFFCLPLSFPLTPLIDARRRPLSVFYI